MARYTQASTAGAGTTETHTQRGHPSHLTAHCGCRETCLNIGSAIRSVSSPGSSLYDEDRTDSDSQDVSKPALFLFCDLSSGVTAQKIDVTAR